MDEEGDVPGKRGPCHIDEKQMANIFSLFHMAKDHRITMDTAKGNAFIVHYPDGRQIKFEATEEGLYVFKPPDTFVQEMIEANREAMEANNRGQTHIVSTVEENQKGYTKGQCERAKAARSLYHTLGCPTIENLKHILRQRIITNCPVTIEDVNIAADIYGPDVGTLKGCLLYTSPSPRDLSTSRMPSSA